MPRTAYGYCPTCFAEGISRTRGGVNARDRCARGHEYLSSTSLDVTCAVCQRAFDFASQPETSAGAVGCPHCGARLDQDGEALGEPGACCAGPLVIGGSVRRATGHHKSRVEFGMMRKSGVPVRGWTAEMFRTPHGAALLYDIYHARLAVLGPAIGKFAKWVQGWLMRLAEDAIRHFVAGVHRHGHWKGLGVKVPLSVTLDLGDLGPLWSSAITQALEASGVEVMMHTKPVFQSVAAAVHERTTILLGGEHHATGQVGVTRRIEGMARQVTRINETTRARLSNLLHEAHEKNDTVAEVIENIRHRIPNMAANRAPTIARTELSRASDEGMKQCYRDSDVLTHVSVIGCEAIEAGIPTYRGIPTCNIQDVPIHDVDLLEFHINHTGCIVPSQFRDADGKVPNVQPHEGFEHQSTPD